MRKPRLQMRKHEVKKTVATHNQNQSSQPKHLGDPGHLFSHPTPRTVKVARRAACLIWLASSYCACVYEESFCDCLRRPRLGCDCLSSIARASRSQPAQLLSEAGSRQPDWEYDAIGWRWDYGTSKRGPRPTGPAGSAWSGGRFSARIQYHVACASLCAASELFPIENIERMNQRPRDQRHLITRDCT